MSAPKFSLASSCYKKRRTTPQANTFAMTTNPEKVDTTTTKMNLHHQRWDFAVVFRLSWCSNKVSSYIKIKAKTNTNPLVLTKMLRASLVKTATQVYPWGCSIPVGTLGRVVSRREGRSSGRDALRECPSRSPFRTHAGYTFSISSHQLDGSPHETSQWDLQEMYLAYGDQPIVLGWNEHLEK